MIVHLDSFSGRHRHTPQRFGACDLFPDWPFPPNPTLFACMETISREAVDSIWEEVMALPPEAAEERFEEAFSHQPEICSYLQEADEDLLPPDERGFLIMIGYCVLRAMSKRPSALNRAVSFEELEEAERENLALIESLDDSSDQALMHAAGQLMSGYSQAPLLGSILEVLVEGNEEDAGELPENVGAMLLHLKTVIDCLNR